MLHKNIGINKDGHLTFAGMDVVSLAEAEGTKPKLFRWHTVGIQIYVVDYASKRHPTPGRKIECVFQLPELHQALFHLGELPWLTNLTNSMRM